MVRAKKLRRKSKIKEYDNLDLLLKNIYGQGFEKLNDHEYKEMYKIAERGNIIYYTFNPYDIQINENESIIFGDDEEALEAQSDLLCEEV